MDGGNGAKTVVYNTKEDSKKRGTEKKNTREKKRGKGRRNTIVKKKSFSLSIILTGHVR